MWKSKRKQPKAKYDTHQQPKSKYDTHPHPKAEQEPDVIMHPHHGTWDIINNPPKGIDDVALYYQQPNAEQFWQHNCSEEGQIGIEKGQTCDWCGATEPKREWVGLTDEEFDQMLEAAKFTRTDLMMIGACVDDIRQMIEAKLKEKNT